MISSKFIINVHSLLKAALYFGGHDLLPTFNHFRPQLLFADQLTCRTPKVKSPNTCLHPTPLHCKYISRNYYDNSSCPYSHSNLVVISTVNFRVASEL